MGGPYVDGGDSGSENTLSGAVRDKRLLEMLTEQVQISGDQAFDLGRMAEGIADRLLGPEPTTASKGYDLPPSISQIGEMDGAIDRLRVQLSKLADNLNRLDRL
jgi:hypothetical protein